MRLFFSLSFLSSLVAEMTWTVLCRSKNPPTSQHSHTHLRNPTWREANNSVMVRLSNRKHPLFKPQLKQTTNSMERNSLQLRSVLSSVPSPQSSSPSQTQREEMQRPLLQANWSARHVLLKVAVTHKNGHVSHFHCHRETGHLALKVTEELHRGTSHLAVKVTEKADIQQLKSQRNKTVSCFSNNEARHVTDKAAKKPAI